MSFMNQHGLASMVKEGTSFVDSPALKNIQACRELSKVIATSMGPDGLCKMVVNQLDKVLVTHDTAAILAELDVEHPAAKLLADAARAMQEEVGDGTNLVVSLAGDLLNGAEELIRSGQHPSDIIVGYRRAGNEALALLEKAPVQVLKDLHVVDQILQPIHTAIGTKMPGYADLLAKLVTEACVNACPRNPANFNVENVRIIKLDGDAIGSSRHIKGFVVGRGPVGTRVRHAKDAKVVLYTVAVDVPSTETKGIALIETADQLRAFNKREEQVMTELIDGIARTGATVVVSASTFSDLSLHLLEERSIMALKVPSRFELLRLGQAVGARQLAQLDPPTREDLGHCDAVDACEVGGRTVTIFEQHASDSRLSTIVVRGSTHQLLDDVERALDDGINVFKALTKDQRVTAGGGALEMHLYTGLSHMADTTPGLDQYAVEKYAEAFQVVPRTLASVAGHNPAPILAQLTQSHLASNSSTMGVDLVTGSVCDSAKQGIVDPLLVKTWAIRFATEAVTTILSVDQIIVAKKSGGPKPPGTRARDSI